MDDYMWNHEHKFMADTCTECGVTVVTFTKAQLEKVTQQRNELLARIFRDGGHFLEQNGDAKAMAVAEYKLGEMFKQLEDAADLIEKFMEELKSKATR